MPQRSQTGQRIRERRLDMGLGQLELAKLAGISGSYLNLIEHDKRRIGGAVLATIAKVLEVDVAHLTEPIETAGLDLLGRGAGRVTEPAEAFAARFPGWAGVVTAQAEQIARLDARVAALTHRMAHDPLLSGALHQVLSTVTSIRSTASILVDGAGDAEWEARFHQNIHDDSLRLAEVSQALVTYLEGPEEALSQSPEEEAAAFLEARSHHFPQAEVGAEVPLPKMTETGRSIVQWWLAQYREDAQALPLEAFCAGVARLGCAPAALAQAFSVPLAVVLRRLASLPPDPTRPAMGLAICDGAGVLLHLKRIDGFDIPRVGGACPLWPMYQALVQLGRPLQQVVSVPGKQASRLTCYALAAPTEPHRFDAPGAVNSTMLVVADAPKATPAPVGQTCSSCLRAGCHARRLPMGIAASVSL